MTTCHSRSIPAGLDGAPYGDRYVAAIYFTLSTLLTVGSAGDVRPITAPERLCAMAGMYAAAGAVAYGLLAAGRALARQLPGGGGGSASRRLAAVDAALARAGAPAALAARVHSYYAARLATGPGPAEPDTLQVGDVNVSCACA